MNTFDNTTCRLIDWSVLNAEISEQMGMPLRIEQYGALVTAGAEPTLLDTEIVALRATDGKFTIPVWDVPEGNAIAIMPRFNANLTLEDIEPCLGDEVLISEYVKDRRGYNARLESNEYAVTQWLNDGGAS